MRAQEKQRLLQICDACILSVRNSHRTFFPSFFVPVTVITARKRSTGKVTVIFSPANVVILFTEKWGSCITGGLGRPPPPNRYASWTGMHCYFACPRGGGCLCRPHLSADTPLLPGRHPPADIRTSNERSLVWTD